jgi:hypothetical protein
MHIGLYFAPLLVAAVVTLVLTGVLRLRNAGLTETQLFLRYWKLWTALVLLDLAATAVSIIWLVSHVPWTRG